MPGKNVQNGNKVQNNSKTAQTHSERMKKFRAAKAKKKPTFRAPNSGNFEHLKRFVASYKQNEAAYNKIMNRKLAQKMAQQKNEPKPETEIKNESNAVIEEPKIQEELQKPTDEVMKANGAETENFEDIAVDDADLEDPALDEELEKLEQKIKKEEELKAMGIDPESVEEPDDPDLDEEVRTLLQENDEKLEGAALEEEFKSLSDEVEGEIKDADVDPENDDPDVNEELNRLGEEIKKEEDAAKLEENKARVPVQTNEIETDQIIEIKEEEQKEPTLADDFELVSINSVEPEPEVIKIVEAPSEKLIPENVEENQVNTEPLKLDTHALFQQIENNVLNPQKNEKKEVVEPKLKEKPKPVYSVPPIPGMNSNVKQENINVAPALSKEEREAKELADAKAALERLRNIRTGTTEERANRVHMINYYQGVVNKYKSSDELLKDSLELAEKARREAKEREEREKQQKALENSRKNDVVEEKDNASPTFENKPHEPLKPEPQQQQFDLFGEDDFFDGRKEDEFERRLAERSSPKPQQQQFDPFGADDFFDGRKEDEFERRLAERPPAEQPTAEHQQQQFDPFGEDDFFDGRKEDEFERRLAEQPPAEGVDPEPKTEVRPVSSEARIAVYEEKLKAYNNMYKLDIDSNKFASSVTEAWELMTSGDKQKMADAQKVMNSFFKDTLKKAFDVEKDVAYNEHRLPEYTEIIKSTNELMRSAMYGFTDMYHNAKRTGLFEATAFGGLNAKDMADLTVGQSLWSMDQKSDEAWDIQSKEAKNIAEKWMKEDKPHEKMIAEMKALVESSEKGIVSRKEMIDKLTAAEWLLENDEKMMIDDPYDPYNKVPNWGNRYWKALAETRETLGIDKYTSMRDMIQADYAASGKAVNNHNYNLMQINYYVLDKDVRELADSRDVQMEQFATMSAAVTLTKPSEKNTFADDMTADRVQYPIKELDQRDIMKHEPKIYNFVGEPKTEKDLDKEKQEQAKLN